MAVVNVTFQSWSLRRSVSFCAYLPENRTEASLGNSENPCRELKTLYMLHGYSGDCHDYLQIQELRELSERYKLVLIYPSGENSFYLDGIDKSENMSLFIGKELVEVTRSMFRLSGKREDTFIGGISMGGYGAMINGLRYSDTFSKIISLSGAYIEVNIADKGDYIPDQVSDAAYQNKIFGDPKKLRFSDKDPRFCMEELIKSGNKLPEIYFVCGENDFLIESNRKLHTFMLDNGISHYYEEGDGVHDWVYWRKHLEPSIKWVLV